MGAKTDMTLFLASIMHFRTNLYTGNKLVSSWHRQASPGQTLYPSSLLGTNRSPPTGTNTIPLLCCGTHRSPPLVPIPYPLSLVVPLGRPRPFFRLHPHPQRFRATGTLAPHCGHDLKLCVLIVICSALSHSTLSACSSRLLVSFSEAFKRRSISISAAAGFLLPEVGRAAD